MSHELISLAKWPSMPAPFSSTDPGEAWVWGDFVVLMQTRPILVAEMLSKNMGMKGIDIPPMSYPYALTVFYRKDRNPHGPSSRPILVVTLEQMDYAAAAKAARTKGIDVGSLGMEGEAPIVQGLFAAELRFNLGHFEGELTYERARSYFLNLIEKRLSLEGEPEKIGAIADIHGHPKTGWPPKEKKGGGCLSVLGMLLLILVPNAVIVL